MNNMKMKYNIYDIIFNLFLTVRKRCFLRRKKWISRITQKGNVDNTDKLPSNWDQILARDQMLPSNYR